MMQQKVMLDMGVKGGNNFEHQVTADHGHGAMFLTTYSQGIVLSMCSIDIGIKDGLP